MSTCCGQIVRHVLVGRQMVCVDAEQHPAGIYAIHAIRGLFYGYRIDRGSAPRPGYTRHRLHIHHKGD